MILKESINTMIILSEEQQRQIFFIKEQILQSIINGNDNTSTPTNKKRLARRVELSAMFADESMKAFLKYAEFTTFVKPITKIELPQALESFRNDVAVIMMTSNNHDLLCACDSVVEDLATWEEALNKSNESPPMNEYR